MAWGLFWGRSCDTFCTLIFKSVNDSVYVKLLMYHFLAVLKHIHDTLGHSVFQLDNAAIYQAAAVMDCFEKYNIQVDDWPLYSPDRNPMQYVWVELKRRLLRKYTEIAYTKEGPDEMNAWLVEVLPEIWEAILEGYIEILWKSMPDRAANVNDAKGWYSRFRVCNSIWFCFSLHSHHYKYLDTLYCSFKDCIIFGWGVILIFLLEGVLVRGCMDWITKAFV